MNLDYFGQPVNFSFSEESPVSRSAAGALVSCIVGFFTLLFMFISIKAWRTYNSTLFTSTVMIDEQVDKIFTREDGFMLAFAIIDDSTEDGSDSAGRSLDEYLDV